MTTRIFHHTPIVYRTIGGLISVLLLGGCAGMNGKFDCHRVDGKGLGCTSVQSVNTLANQGTFHSTPGVTARANQATASRLTLTRVPFKTPNAGDPLRVKDTVQRIWIAPYQDQQGHYHEPSYVVTVVKRSHWLGLSPPAIQSSDTNNEE